MSEGYEGLKTLAKMAKTNPQYLRQCATEWNGKHPSPKLAAVLVVLDSRLTFADIYRSLTEEVVSSLGERVE
ncbi:MAG: hypothetical protein KZQ94_10285 [Candidatus Thiodiazotropha sp. (ex Troendleina suluensis)]|nr:hypothetical protein [Candidatus Thiodiazotropha sp. (ex Troendleina suluensis)]